MAYGVTDQGFVLPRLQDILTQQRARAVELFQDLVAAGDVVDTSDSSLLGRLIALEADGASDLWEVGQDLWGAFDPNSAYGIALDNLVTLSGISRSGSTYSTAQAIFTGDVGTLINSGLTIRSVTTANDYLVRTSVTLNTTNSSGVGVQALTVADNTTYSLSYTSSTTTNTISYTSGSSATQVSILSGIANVISASHPSLTTTLVNNILYVDRVAVFDVVSWASSSNLGILKTRKVGSLIADQAGPLASEANTLTQIQTPILGWDAVYNPSAVASGSYTETDEELRLRFRDSKYSKATNILEALYSDLINLSTVKEVRIYENDTDQVDEFGVPAHSFLPIILGGDPLEIAESIWENKPLGIRSYGNTTQSIFDSQGFSHDIGFERPNPVNIFIKIDLTTDTNYPENGDDSIKSNLTKYFENNFGIGDDVIYSRLYTPINNVQGHQVNSLQVSTDGVNYSSNNIQIAFNAIANLESNNITISKS